MKLISLAKCKIIYVIKYQRRRGKYRKIISCATISFYVIINLIGKKHEVFLNKFYKKLIKSKRKEMEHVVGFN